VKSVFNGGYRGAAVGFSIGTKGYIGTGYDDLGVRRNDFWEYDTGLLCLPGTSCDDGDGCTSNDAYNTNCACVGTSARIRMAMVFVIRTIRATTPSRGSRAMTATPSPLVMR
jgi:hypothetical protein